MKILRVTAMTSIGFAVIALFSGCADKYARTDIALEMTDEDSIEAIIDADLLTVGGTLVYLDDRADVHSAEATVSYVDEVEVQTPTIVTPDDRLRPRLDPIDEPPRVTPRDPVVTEPREPDRIAVVDDIRIDDDIFVEDIDFDDEYTRMLDDIRVAEIDVMEEEVTPVEIDVTEVVDITETVDVTEVAVVPEEPRDEVYDPQAVRTTAAGPRDRGHYVRVSPHAPVRYPRYTVQRGDTLWSISRDKGVTISDLCAANNITRSTILQIGQELIIPIPEEETREAVSPREPVTAPEARAISETLPPAPQVATELYTVQEGDSYWKIARKFNINYLELMALNDTSDPLIRPGDKILVPRR